MSRFAPWVLQVAVACLITGCTASIPLPPQEPTARPQGYAVEEIRVPGEGLELAGSLYTPDACSSCPAMVFLGGGSAETRTNQVSFAEQFARAGIVSLIYDKRGAGASSGQAEGRSFEDLTEDALSAVRFLQAQPGVDPGAVGVWGGSEGGTIALIAASRSSDISYVVNLAGPVEHFRAGQLYDLDLAMAEESVPEAEREALRGLWEVYFDDAADGVIEPAVLAQAAPWRARGMGTLVPPDTAAYPPEPSPPPRSYWYLHRLDVLGRLDVPVLMVFGGRDEWVPAERNIAIIEQAFAPRRKTDYDVHVFPAASHAFTTPEGVLVDRFFETQIEWVLARGHGR